MSKKGIKDLPEKLKHQHTHVTLNPDTLENTSTPIAHDIYRELGIDNSFDAAEFQKNFKVVLLNCFVGLGVSGDHVSVRSYTQEIRSMNKEEMVVDLYNIDPPIANALRRIIIAEVPTMAIETVYISENTSIMQDEVLAHRLGLIPINADPRLFEYHTGDEYNDKDTLLFELDVTCSRNPGTLDSDVESVKYKNSVVMSGDLVWRPQGEQQEGLASLVHDDILLLQLRPGQRITCSCFCTKGVGKDHAKFSPVATASYRLMPDIQIKEPITGESAKKLVDTCPMKVFDIEDLGGTKSAKVVRPENCTICRECIRHDEWSPKINLTREKSHYILSVSIESTGALSPQDIFTEALKQFMEKINILREALPM